MTSVSIPILPKQQTSLKIYSLVGLMVFLWAGNYIVAKVALREIPAMLLMSLRMAIAGAIMLPFLAKDLRGRATPLTRKELGIYGLLGIGGVMLNQFFFVVGISKTTVTHSAMIVATVPVWVLLGASMLGIERITIRKTAGMALAIVGVGFLQIFRPKISSNAPTAIGDLIMFAGAFLFAMMTAFGKRFNPRGSAILVNSIGYIGGAILLAPVGWRMSQTFDLRQVSLTGWLGVVYMAAFSSVLCYLIYYWVLERIPASRIATFQYLQPFLAMVMAVLLLGEELPFPALISGAMIIGGVLLTERSPSRVTEE